MLALDRLGIAGRMAVIGILTEERKWDGHDVTTPLTQAEMTSQ